MDSTIEMKYMTFERLDHMHRRQLYSEHLRKFTVKNLLRLTTKDSEELHDAIHGVLWLRAEIIECRRRLAADTTMSDSSFWQNLDYSRHIITHWHEWMNYIMRKDSFLEYTRERAEEERGGVLSLLMRSDRMPKSLAATRNLRILQEELSAIHARLTYEFEFLRTTGLFQRCGTAYRFVNEPDDDALTAEERALTTAVAVRFRDLDSSAIVRMTDDELDYAGNIDDITDQALKLLATRHPPSSRVLAECFCRVLSEYGAALRQDRLARVNYDCTNIIAIDVWQCIWRRVDPTMFFGEILPRLATEAFPFVRRGSGEDNRRDDNIINSTISRDLARVAYDMIIRCFESPPPPPPPSTLSAERGDWFASRDTKSMLLNLFRQLLHRDAVELAVPIGLLLPRADIDEYAKRAISSRKRNSPQRQLLLYILHDARNCSDQLLPPTLNAASTSMRFGHRGLISRSEEQLSPYTPNVAIAVELAYSGLILDNRDKCGSSSAVLASAVTGDAASLDDDEWLDRLFLDISTLMTRNARAPCSTLYPRENTTVLAAMVKNGIDTALAREEALRDFRRDGLLRAICRARCRPKRNERPSSDEAHNGNEDEDDDDDDDRGVDERTVTLLNAANACCVRLLAHMADGIHRVSQFDRRREKSENILIASRN